MFRFSDTDNFKLTPLHLAASTGNTDMVKYLLRNNVSPCLTWMPKCLQDLALNDARVALILVSF